MVWARWGRKLVQKRFQWLLDARGYQYDKAERGVLSICQNLFVVKSVSWKVDGKLVTEIGAMTVASSLSELHSFASLQNLNIYPILVTAFGSIAMLLMLSPTLNQLVLMTFRGSHLRHLCSHWQVSQQSPWHVITILNTRLTHPPW